MTINLHHPCPKCGNRDQKSTVDAICDSVNYKHVGGYNTQGNVSITEIRTSAKFDKVISFEPVKPREVDSGFGLPAVIFTLGLPALLLLCSRFSTGHEWRGLSVESDIVLSKIWSGLLTAEPLSLSTTLTAIAVIISFVWLVAANRQQKRNHAIWQQEMGKWRLAHKRWKDMLYCGICGHVFSVD